MENIINVSSSQHSSYEEIKKNLFKIKSILNSLKFNEKIYLIECDNDIKLIFWETIQELISINFYDENDICFSDLSYGERGFYIHFLFLLYLDENHSKSNEKENTFFLIDEPDTTFHPNWQKKYINQLLSIYKNYKKNVHFIITSHSPFILSDLPKENVIFLDKYKKEDEEVKNEKQKIGNCKNVSKQLELQTFGANIHTLLSHGFFMKDGLMGEFAKNKISKILNFLNGKNKFIDIQINQIKPTIEIIGEDFLREKLLIMYDERFKVKSKDDEIKELKAEIERLKNAQNRI